MFGLTRREQRWKAEQQAGELMAGFASVVIRSVADARVADARVAEAQVDAAELARLLTENAELRRALDMAAPKPGDKT